MWRASLTPGLPAIVMFYRFSLSHLAAALTLAALGACTAPQPGAEFNDPYEETNRAVHNFNKGLDRVALRPAGQAAAALPEGVTQPVQNFADNLSLPGMIINGVLQGDADGAITNFMRLVINTTLGIGGLADIAAEMGLEEESTDFGETLHVWGVPEGAYIELPGLGPSTERDAAGQIVDFALNPLSRLGTTDLARAGTASRAADLVIARGRLSDTIDSVLYESADSYAQSRLIYLQNRRFELGEPGGNGQIGGTGIDPFALDLEGFE